MTSIETERVLLRPFVEADVEAAFAWFSDPHVMRYTRGPDQTIDATRARIQAYKEQQTRLGFSKWIAIEKATNEPIGDAGLLVANKIGPFPDLGYRLKAARWGVGLGSEIAGAWVRAAFEVFDLATVTAFAHVDNSRSHRVLEKAGFSRIERRVVIGVDSWVYTHHGVRHP